MKARIKWVENVLFAGETGSGHGVLMDGAPEFGGRDLAARPMEMVLLGLGGCTAFDVVTMLQKGRHAVTDCQVEIEAERADTPPKVFTRIRVHYIVEGRDLPEKAVARACSLSAEKYCSVSIMLGKSVEMSHDFEIRESQN